MKNHVALYGSAAAIVACGLIIARNTEEVPAALLSKSGVSQAEASVATHAVTSAEALAQAGTLWEPQAGDSREAQRTAIQVAAAPLRDALAAAPGSRVKLALSPRFAPLEATVTASNTHEDGTITTFLRVEGSPAGTLTLQENVEAGFFLGQLYYDGDHPVAYEFRPQGDAMEVTRHAVSDLVCSELDAGSTKVDSAGLPSVEAINGIENGKKSKKKSASNANSSSSISISDATLTEGDSGTANLTFTVRLSQTNPKATTTVNFTTVDGSAIAGTDYVAKSGTVTFRPKDVSETITIPVLGDLISEDNKTFTVQLSNPVNATIGDSVGIGTILDNDSAPTLSISGASVNEGNSGLISASVAVTLSKAFT
ncbi:MAG TPA: Calx-beta domain-containing protein, partial [Luteolibacter sp.]